MSATEKSSSAEGDERYRVRSVERALDVLETLAEADSVGLRLAELSRRLDTSKSTVLAVLLDVSSRRESSARRSPTESASASVSSTSSARSTLRTL